MTEHLAHTNPDLARLVMAFDGPQLLALSAFVFQAHALVGVSGRQGRPGEAGNSV